MMMFNFNMAPAFTNPGSPSDFYGLLGDDLRNDNMPFVASSPLPFEGPFGDASAPQDQPTQELCEEEDQEQDVDSYEPQDLEVEEGENESAKHGP